jgi:hypothetical protein
MTAMFNKYKKTLGGILIVLITTIGNQAYGWYAWRAEKDTQVAVLQAKCQTTEKTVDSISDKVNKIYELMIEQSKKN